jgi:hypothetical protein
MRPKNLNLFINIKLHNQWDITSISYFQKITLMRDVVSKCDEKTEFYRNL